MRRPYDAHVPLTQGCDQFSSMLFGLRVKGSLAHENPTVQIAFAVFHVPPNGPTRRVLRVHTLQLHVAKDWQALYGGVDPEIVGASIVQRVRVV